VRGRAAQIALMASGTFFNKSEGIGEALDQPELTN
jgi:hypothetical protein